MEDPDMEWEIVDYSSSCFEDEDDTEKSRLGWILNAGLSLGKKLVITGVVISSVPIVLPPLVVISALCLAFSMPFGFVFASYACTEKLMSKLLLPSPAPAREEDGEEEEEEEEEEEGLLVVDDIEKEEMKQGEGLRDEIQMRIELVDHYDGDKEGYEGLDVDGNDLKIDEEGRNGDLSEGKDEKNTAVEGNAINTEDKQILESYEENPIVPQSASSQTDNNLIVENEAENYKNAEAVDEIDEVKVEKFVTMVPKEKSSSSKRGKRKKASGKRKEAEREKRHEKERELLEAMSKNNVVIEEEKNVDVSTEKKHADEDEKEKELLEAMSKTNVDVCSEKEHGDEGEGIVMMIDDLGNSERSLEKEEGLKTMSDMGSIAGETKTSDESELILKGGEPSEVVVVEKEKSVDDDDGTTREHLIIESGDSENVVVIDDDIRKVEVSMEKEEEEEPEGLETTLQGQSVDELSSSAAENYRENSMGLAPPSTVELEHKEEEEVRDEEKIWKEMESIRVIVGYRAPTRPSYFEELKALYLFTGIEPPSSFTEPSNLSEFYNKLRFLKSVIGIK